MRARPQWRLQVTVEEGGGGGGSRVALIRVREGGRTIRIEVATGYTVGTIAERQFISDRMDERVYNIIICT